MIATLILSCEPEKANHHDVSAPQGSAELAHVPSGPTPEQIAQEQSRIRDSIRAAEEERIRQAQIEEDKSMKLKDAALWVGDFSQALMKIVSPWAGKKLTHRLLLDESTYNPDTKTLNVVFQVEWDAIATYAGGEPERHVYKGQYSIYGTGETRLEELSRNEVLTRAIEATNAMKELNELLNRTNSAS